MYAIISITDYYGPETKIEVEGFYKTRSEAVEKCDELNESDDCYLSHNQASVSNYEVRRVDPVRCGRGYNNAPMYRGHYLPDFN
jgi:hypothetical protein